MKMNKQNTKEPKQKWIKLGFTSLMKLCNKKKMKQQHQQQ